MLSAEAIKWGFWIVATFGVAGTVALFVLAPAMATVVVNALTSILKLVIGTRIGCAVLMGIIAFAVADYHRAALDEIDFQKKIAEFHTAEKLRDSKIDQMAREQVRAELDAEQTASAAVDKQKDDFDASLKPLPAADDQCLVGPNANELRTIAGDRRSERKTHKPVSKARKPRIASGH